MARGTRVWLVGCGIAAQLLTAGCLGGGSGGLGSFFGFGGGSGGSDSGSSFASSSGEQGGGGFGGGFSAPSAATAHNPEPASIALFGTGLTGLAMFNRRKARRRSS